MKIIQKIRDFIVKHFSMGFWRKHWLGIRAFFVKHFSKDVWRERWLDILAFPRKRVDAAILETLCGYLNPSYSDLVDRFQRATGEGGLLHAEELIDSFYNDREDFLTRLKNLLNYHCNSGYASSLYEEFREIYVLVPEKFKQLVVEQGLEKHVRILNNPVLGESLNLKNIKVEGNVNLTFGGRFGLWMFDNIKFCDAVTVNIYPHFLMERSRVDFYKNIFHHDFTFLFAFVKHIFIEGNKFQRSVLIGADTTGAENKDAVAQWKKDMIHHKIDDFHTSSTVVFSSNRCESLVTLYTHFGGKNFPGIDMVKFEGGNIIGGLSLPDSKLAKIGPEYRLHRIPRPPHTIWGRWVRRVCQTRWVRRIYIPNWEKIKPYHLQANARSIGNIHFDINEHIKMPYKPEALLYKEFFIDLKNKAIETHDREAEFNYGRKERYFDRGVTSRKQDKFLLWWSHLVSDGGISWIRPSVILFCGQWILAAIFIGGLCECGDYVAWFRAAVESLNPLSSLSDVVKSPDCEEGWVDSLPASIYGEVRRIFTLALYYEIIKTLRRFYN